MKPIACLLLCASLYAQDAAPPPDPVKWRLADAPKSAKAGEIFMVTLTAKIDEPWYVFSAKKHDGDPVALAVTAPTPQAFRISGAIDAPVGQTAFDERFSREVEFYVGEIEVQVPVQVLRDAKPGAWKLRLDVRYQAADNKQCLPATTVKLEQEITVGE